MFKKTSKFSIFDVEIQYEFLFQHFDIRTHNSKISQHCFVLLYIKIQCNPFILISLIQIIENLRKLVKGSRDELGLSAVNGVKAFAMIFIIAGHALLFMVGGPTLNSEFYAKVSIIRFAKYLKIISNLNVLIDLKKILGNPYGTKCFFAKFTALGRYVSIAQWIFICTFAACRIRKTQRKSKLFISVHIPVYKVRLLFITVSNSYSFFYVVYSSTYTQGRGRFKHSLPRNPKIFAQDSLYIYFL